MNKSSKIVSLFLTTALILGTSACAKEKKVTYDKEGNPIVQQNSSPGFFGGFFGPLGPFGYFGGRSSGVSTGTGTTKSPGVSAGGQSGSTSPSGGTGITSGSHGGIGGGGSSVS